MVMDKVRVKPSVRDTVGLVLGLAQHILLCHANSPYPHRPAFYPQPVTRCKSCKAWDFWRLSTCLGTNSCGLEDYRVLNGSIHMGSTWRIRLNGPCCVAMWAVATATVATCLLSVIFVTLSPICLYVDLSCVCVRVYVCVCLSVSEHI